MSTSCDYQQNGESRVWFSPSELQAEQPEISDPILRYYNFRLAQEPNAPDSKIMDGGGNGHPFITFGDARGYVAQSSAGSGRGLAEEIERHFDDPRNIRMLLDKRDCLDVIVPALRPPPVGDDVKRRAIELVGEFMGDCVATHWGRQMCALTERLLSEIDSRAVPARADEEWRCKARSCNLGGSDPQDCDWPFCGCDPKADRVIEALQESGWSSPLAQSPARSAGSDDLQEALEALDRAGQFIRNGIALGYIRMPDPDCPDTAHETPRIIEAAAAKLRSRLASPRERNGEGDGR